MSHGRVIVPSNQAILDQIERRERRQRITAIALFIFLSSLAAAVWSDSQARPNGRDVIGEVVRFGTNTSNKGPAYWVDVQLDGQSVIRAPIDKPAMALVGEQVVVAEITTPIFGFRRYVCTGAVGKPPP